jgi:hypothetical protein
MGSVVGCALCQLSAAILMQHSTNAGEKDNTQHFFGIADFTYFALADGMRALFARHLK